MMGTLPGFATAVPSGATKPRSLTNWAKRTAEVQPRLKSCRPLKLNPCDTSFGPLAQAASSTVSDSAIRARQYRFITVVVIFCPPWGQDGIPGRSCTAALGLAIELMNSIESTFQ